MCRARNIKRLNRFGSDIHPNYVYDAIQIVTNMFFFYFSPHSHALVLVDGVTIFMFFVIWESKKWDGRRYLYMNWTPLHLLLHIIYLYSTTPNSRIQNILVKRMGAWHHILEYVSSHTSNGSLQFRLLSIVVAPHSSARGITNAWMNGPERGRGRESKECFVFDCRFNAGCLLR